MKLSLFNWLPQLYLSVTVSNRLCSRNLQEIHDKQFVVFNAVRKPKNKSYWNDSATYRYFSYYNYASMCKLKYLQKARCYADDIAPYVLSVHDASIHQLTKEISPTKLTFETKQLHISRTIEFQVTNLKTSEVLFYIWVDLQHLE